MVKRAGAGTFQKSLRSFSKWANLFVVATTTFTPKEATKETPNNAQTCKRHKIYTHLVFFSVKATKGQVISKGNFDIIVLPKI